MEAISAELNGINQRLTARDNLDAERRKVDDRRDEEAKASAKELLRRVDGHGSRLSKLEVNWMTFFSEDGAFTYVKRKIQTTDKQNRWIIALGFTTLIGVIVNLWIKHQ
jgi:hypothetical protein